MDFVSFDNLKLSPLKLSLGKSPSLHKLTKDFCLASLYNIKKRQPNYKRLENIEEEDDIKDFNYYNYKYSLGFFSGCHKFIFRVNFKEYKIGLKPAKFSLLLNQFCVDLDLFIGLIQELLINNFSIDFYEDLFKDYINDLDFKIHFLIILRQKYKNKNLTKFFIIPIGCFLIYLRKQLWYTLFVDFIFIYNCSKLYKGFKKYLGIIFLLVLFYVNKLIHQKLTQIVNKYKHYVLEERKFSSLGNVFSLHYNSFKLYSKRKLRLLRHSYFFLSRCLNFFISDEEFEDSNILGELTKINSQEFILVNSLDLVEDFLDIDIKDN